MILLWWTSAQSIWWIEVMGTAFVLSNQHYANWPALISIPDCPFKFTSFMLKSLIFDSIYLQCTKETFISWRVSFFTIFNAKKQMLKFHSVGGYHYFWTKKELSSSNLKTKQTCISVHPDSFMGTSIWTWWVLTLLYLASVWSYCYLDSGLNQSYLA